MTFRNSAEGVGPPAKRADYNFSGEDEIKR